MSWTKDNGKFAKEAAEQALLQANYLDEKKPLIDKFTNDFMPTRNIFDGIYLNGVLGYTNPNVLRYRKNLPEETNKIAVIPIEPNKTYTVTCHDSDLKEFFRVAVNDTEPIFGGFVDASRTIVSDDSLNTITFTNNDTGLYLMVFLSSYAELKLQVEEGDSATTYINHYALKGDSVDIKEVPIKDGSIEGKQLKDAKVSTKNLYNESTALMNTLFTINGGTANLNGFYLTDFIPIESNKKYTISNGNIQNLIAWYDVNKTFLGRTAGVFGEGLDNPFTATVLYPTARFMRVNVKKQGITGQYMIVEGDALPTNYTPFNDKKVEVDWLKINPYQISKYGTRWYNKNLYLFGDSITYWDQAFASYVEPGEWVKGYASYIREELGAKVYNKGRQGATLAVKSGIPSINTIMRSTDLTNAYACLITGGTNDNGNSIPIGTVGGRDDTTFDTSTFCGALRDCIHYAYSQNPLIKIYIMTPNQSSGFHHHTYLNAMKEIANMYALPIIDVNGQCQINKITAPYLTYDGLHPNNEGYKKMADVIVPFLANH